MDDIRYNIIEKKTWKTPLIFPLSIKKTEGGDYSDIDEDYGDIVTDPPNTPS